MPKLRELLSDTPRHTAMVGTVVTVRFVVAKPTKGLGYIMNHYVGKAREKAARHA